MKNIVLAALLAVTFTVPAGAVPAAGEAPMSLGVASIPAAPGRPMSRALVEPVGWWCRRECDRCRRYCDWTYRDRRAFTLCMRDCWYRICRWC